MHAIIPYIQATIFDFKLLLLLQEYDNTQALSLTPVMDCNHGVQMGSSCVCDEGWASSGLDSGDKKYYWCDVRDSTGMSFDTGPVVLSPLHEMLLVMVSSEVYPIIIVLLSWCIYSTCKFSVVSY